MAYRVISAVVDIHESPSNNATRGKYETQLVFGEEFTITEKHGDWYKGITTHDGYQGYIEAKHLKETADPTHIINAARSHVYQDSSMKSPLVTTLSFGSLVTITNNQDNYSFIKDLGWIFTQHLSPMASIEKDYLASAEKFLETPYYWGGRSGFGIDCSGLAQVCLARAGIKVPRDTGDQAKSIDTTVATPEKGDIVFFKGHVGFMLDTTHILHADGFQMKVICEELKETIKKRGEPTSIRRIKG